jgi:hypothetical protein
MPYLFQPPTVAVVPPVGEGVEDDPLGCRLMAHFGSRLRGYTVFHYPDGTVSPFPGVLSPTQYDEVGIKGGSVAATYNGDVQADRMPFITEYLGGHIYEVSDAEASVLTAAGYTLVKVSGYGNGGYGTGRYGG